MCRFSTGDLGGNLGGYHAATLPAVPGNLSRVPVTAQIAAEVTRKPLCFQKDAAKVTSGSLGNRAGRRGSVHTHTQTDTDTENTQGRRQMRAYK